MFKTLRQQRHVWLKEHGMLPFEAQKLSDIPMRQWRRAPYLRKLLDERRDEYSDWLASSRRVSWGQVVKAKYAKHRWYRPHIKIQIADPWAMLRDAEDRFRVKNPAYDSPWERKGRKLSPEGYRAKAARTRARQRQHGERAGTFFD